MAGELKVTILGSCTGLGTLDEIADTFTTTTTPTRKVKIYQVQAVADTAEALDVGDITTVECVILVCVANDVDIDTSFNTTFSAEITVNEGEVAVFKPTGTIYIKNDDAGEAVTVEALIVGT